MKQSVTEFPNPPGGQSPMPSDAELLCEYATERSEAAFAELVRRHLDGVYSAALRRVGFDAHLAQDIAQTVFIALARQSRALASHPLLIAWLYSTTRNESVNTIRRERRRKAREAAASAMNATNASASQQTAADWSRLAPLLDTAIDELSETDRAAILLRFIEQKPFAAIGEKLRVTEDAARMRVDRALEKLRIRLARRGLISTNSALGLALANQAVTAAPAACAASLTAAALSAPVLPGAIAAFAAFMSTTKTTLSLAALACLLAGGLATHQIVRAHAAESALVEDRKNYEYLLARHRELETKILSAQQSTRPPSPLPASVPANSQNTKSEDPRATGAAFLERHPEVKRALQDYKRAQTLHIWGPFLETENLTPEQSEKFIQIMTASGWFGPSTAPGEKPMVLSLGDSADPNDGEKRLREILGEELYQKRVEFGRLNSSRKFAEKIAATLAFSDEPLTPAQAASLVPILAGSKAAKSPDRTTNFDWDAIVAKAGGLLTPAQLDALEGMRAQDEFNWALSQSSKQVRETLSSPRPAVSAP